MFDIGFIELVICAVIALLVLGPERLPVAARTAGRWIGGARRMVSQFTSELDRQLKADELRKELREAGDVGLEDVEKTVRDALDEAKEYEHMVLSDDKRPRHRPAPATRRVASKPSQPSADEPEDDAEAASPPDDRQRLKDWEPPAPGHDPYATIRQASQSPDSAQEPEDPAATDGDPPKDNPERHS